MLIVNVLFSKLVFAHKSGGLDGETPIGVAPFF
jgi:hypothetical protein